MSVSSLVFATKNQGKVAELRHLLQSIPVTVFALNDLAISVPDIVEDGDSYCANARKKATMTSRYCNLPALADDSGLEVVALENQPGVHSARYAKYGATSSQNNAKLIQELDGIAPERRQATFRCFLSLSDWHGRLGTDSFIEAEGQCHGLILEEPQGIGGFGYDSLFFLPEQGCTFAEISSEEKNLYSHRANALHNIRQPLVDYLIT